MRAKTAILIVTATLFAALLSVSAARAQVHSSARVRVPGNILRVLQRVDPVYPGDAKAAHISGTVVVHVVIAKDGTVQEAEPVSGSPMLLHAAVDAVRQWKFQPTLLNHESVEVDSTVNVVFDLDTSAPAGDAPKVDLADDPQFKADVVHLLDVMHVREDMVQGAGDGFDALSAQLQDLLPDIPDKDKILEAYRKALVGMFQSQDLTDRIVAVYADYLSDEDVKGITQFFESPAGQHFKTTENDMNNNVANAVGQMGQAKVPGILSGLCTEFPELEGKVAFCAASEERKSVMLDQAASPKRGL